jgi:hypothetical protein
MLHRDKVKRRLARRAWRPAHELLSFRADCLRDRPALLAFYLPPTRELRARIMSSGR